MELEETRVMDQQEPAISDVVPSVYSSVAGVNQLQTTTHDPFQGRRQTAFKLVQAIYLLVGFINSLIVIRVVLRLLAANPSATFARWIYGVTDWLGAPFAGLFSAAGVGGGVLELNALVALAVYALLAWSLAKVAWLAIGETRTGLMARRRYVQAHIE
jgi:uncharacterized membrane protein